MLPSFINTLLYTNDALLPLRTRPQNLYNHLFSLFFFYQLYPAFSNCILWLAVYYTHISLLNAIKCMSLQVSRTMFRLEVVQDDFLHPLVIVLVHTWV